MITDIKVLDTPVKPKKKVKGIENGLDLPKHMAEHVYMFSDETVRVRFVAKKYIVNEIIDWFGKDIKFRNETEDEVIVEVRSSGMAMKYWALQYAPHITVIEPQALREEIGNELRKAAERYGK
jgi:predicted DNA-binding transcriptional regulator YafY